MLEGALGKKKYATTKFSIVRAFIERLVPLLG
jgi:hypothetical protein